MTLFGGADLNYRSVTSGTNKFQGMAQDGIYSSRFGVRGEEDLGGGLKANFHFEGGMNPDTGTPGGFNFARKSTIGVAGGFGEVRMGRDYTPLFTIAGIADPFGTNGVGSSYNLANSVTLASSEVTAADVTTAGGFATAATATANAVYADPNAVRANNSVAYYSPSFSGFTAGLMYSFGSEATGTTNRDAGKMTSLKLQYGNGPLVAALGTQSTKGATDQKAKWATTFLAGSYDLGVAKVSAGYKTDKLTETDGVNSGSIKSTILGVAVPMGATTLKASYVARKAEEKIGNQLAFGAVHDLSKRTSVYGTYSVLKNEEGFGNTVGSAIASDFTGLKSKGFEFGVKHNF
ncbi:porin [Limnohabitans sp. 63ED37-2]|uniref:porin n=1 Tax=Limnohabitans sp. 63ED37-2 TaxID=1678128 RepID=UPI001E4AADB8|nr:porin [Limnohabitans sp. 63ED37-2]